MNEPKDRSIRLVATVEVGDHQTDEEVAALNAQIQKMLGGRVQFLEQDDVVMMYRPHVEDGEVLWEAKELPPDDMESGEKTSEPEQKGDVYYYATGPALGKAENKLKIRS